MGVMRCGRYDCEHIMCTRLILDRSMYICEYCYDELLATKRMWPTQMSAREVEDRIREFMRSPVRSQTLLDGEQIDEEFERLTS